MDLNGEIFYREAVIDQSPESRSALWVRVTSRVFYAESVIQELYNAFGVKIISETDTQGGAAAPLTLGFVM